MIAKDVGCTAEELLVRMSSEEFFWRLAVYEAEAYEHDLAMKKAGR